VTLLIARLVDFCEIVQGGRLKLSGNDFVPDGYPAYGAGGLNGYLPVAEFHRSGVILSSIGARCGKCFLADGEWTSLANTQVILPDPERADARYLWYQLNDERRWHRSGTAQPFIKPSDVKGHAVALPPLPEQRRITSILDQAEELRTKRRESLARIDSLAQSIFLDMFGDPRTNPKGWHKSSIAELLAKAEVFVDGDWVESKDQDPNGDVRLIQLADIGDGFYQSKSAQYLTRPTAQRLKCTFLMPGDVLIARMPDPLGRACIFPGDIRDSVTVVDVCIVRPSGGSPDPYWFMSCLNSAGMRSAIACLATGTTRSRMSRGNLSRLEIISPPLELQREFSR
jgi:restriction endonuclease S subunit